MCLYRFRLRTLLIAVAIIALMLWGGIMWRISSRYREKATEHTEWVDHYENQIKKCEQLAVEEEHKAERLRQEAEEIRPPEDPMIWSNDKKTNQRRLEELRAEGGIDRLRLLFSSAQAHHLKVEADDAYEVATRYRSWIAELRKKVEYHRNLERKYRRASSRPWLPITPDPPELDP